MITFGGSTVWQARSKLHFPPLPDDSAPEKNFVRGSAGDDLKRPARHVRHLRALLRQRFVSPARAGGAADLHAGAVGDEIAALVREDRRGAAGGGDDGRRDRRG